MAEVTTTLQEIEVYEGIAKSSGKAYTRFTAKGSDGRKYVTFKREIIEPGGALKGQQVVISYDESQNGDYTNYDLTGIRSALSQATGATETPSQDTLGTQTAPTLDSLGLAYTGSGNNVGLYTASPASPTQEKKDISIARAVALKAAVETATGLQLVEADSDSILRIANVYVGWLLSGESNPFADLSPDVPDAVDAKGELVKF